MFNSSLFTFIKKFAFIFKCQSTSKDVKLLFNSTVIIYCCKLFLSLILIIIVTLLKFTFNIYSVKYFIMTCLNFDWNVTHTLLESV